MDCDDGNCHLYAVYGACADEHNYCPALLAMAEKAKQLVSSGNARQFWEYARRNSKISFHEQRGVLLLKSCDGVIAASIPIPPKMLASVPRDMRRFTASTVATAGSAPVP